MVPDNNLGRDPGAAERRPEVVLDKVGLVARFQAHSRIGVRLEVGFVLQGDGINGNPFVRFFASIARTVDAKFDLYLPQTRWFLEPS